jgi:hypothetical protein
MQECKNARTFVTSVLAFLAFLYFRYSYLRATMGSMRVARSAGT